MRRFIDKNVTAIVRYPKESVTIGMVRAITTRAEWEMFSSGLILAIKPFLGLLAACPGYYLIILFCLKGNSGRRKHSFPGL